MKRCIRCHGPLEHGLAIWCRDCRQRGQAIVELTLVLPILLALGLGAADIGTAGLRIAIGHNAAVSIAGMLAQDIAQTDSRIVDELVRAECDLGWIVEDAPLVTVGLTCPHVSLTGLLPATLTVDASATRVASGTTARPFACDFIAPAEPWDLGNNGIWWVGGSRASLMLRPGGYCGQTITADLFDVIVDDVALDADAISLTGLGGPVWLD